MACGLRRKSVKDTEQGTHNFYHGFDHWKSQEIPASFPVVLHFIVLPRGHQALAHRALGAGFQGLFQKKNKK